MRCHILIRQANTCSGSVSRTTSELCPEADENPLTLIPRKMSQGWVSRGQGALSRSVTSVKTRQVSVDRGLQGMILYNSGPASSSRFIRSVLYYDWRKLCELPNSIHGPLWKYLNDIERRPQAPIPYATTGRATSYNETSYRKAAAPRKFYRVRFTHYVY